VSTGGRSQSFVIVFLVQLPGCTAFPVDMLRLEA